MAMVATLASMGFSEGQIQAGLKATGSKEIETVVNWIISNPDAALGGTSVDGPAQSQGYVLGSAPGSVASSDTSAPGDTAASSGGEVAQSLKCEDCGRILRNTIEAEAHAAKTQHQNFSESTEEVKPLTEEEKKEKLKELQLKMAARRKEREEQEKAEALAKEKSRRREGQTLSQVKEDHHRKEMMQIAEERRREKEADRIAREKVKADIARDRANKKAALEKEANSSAGSSASSGNLSCASSSTQQPGAPVTSATPVNRPDYSETRLQIRYKGGSPKVQKFSVDEPLSAVRLFAQLNATVPLSNNFTLMTTFPKKIFTEDEMEMPLKLLGLVPSAVLDIHERG